MKIALLVDNPFRDLPGLALVASQLASQGAQCYLTPMNLAYYNRAEEILRLGPDLVVVNYLRLNNSGFLRDMVGLGIPFAVLDTEGGVLVSCQSYLKNVDALAPLYKYCSGYFSWGSKLGKFLVDEKVYSPDQVIVTGSPRHDFYSDPWKKVPIEANPAISDFKKPIILLNSNFPIINPSFVSAANEKEMLVKQHGFSPEEAEGICLTQKQAMVDFVDIANTLAREFPQASIIFRPHPFESEIPYQRMLDKSPNLHLVKKGTVDGWILSSACVIQRGCSTAIEAGLAGVPTFSPLWVPMHLVQSSAESVSVPVSSKNQLITLVREVLEGCFTPTEEIGKNLDQVLNDWFFNRDGLAHERVARAVSALLQSRGNEGKGKKDINQAYKVAMAFSFRDRIKGLLGAVLGLPPNWAWANLRRGIIAKPTNPPTFTQRFWAFLGFLMGKPRNHPWFQPHYGQWSAVYQWLNGPKAFTATEVEFQLTGIRKAASGEWNDLKAFPCQPGMDYLHGGHPGASVKITK